MRTRAAGIAVGVAMAALLGGCGGGGSKSATTTAAPTTTTIVSAEDYAANICSAGRSIADAEHESSGFYRLNAETYSKVVPPPDKKASLDAYVAANRALAALWSDPKPITPDAFSEQLGKLTETYLKAVTAVQVECPPQPGATTTAPAAIRAQGQLYSVARHEGGKGLWWYTSFSCPEGTKLKLGPGLVPLEGQAHVGVVLDEAAGAAEVFTGVVADQSYGRVDDKIRQTTCA